MSEEILGIFPAWIPKGPLPLKQEYKLVFTTDRLIVARRKRLFGLSLLTHPEYIISRASALERMRMKESASAESILKDDAENFEIPYSVITVVDVEEHGKGYPFDLKVFTDDLYVSKYKFKIDLMYRYFDEFMGFLRTVLPDKV